MVLDEIREALNEFLSPMMINGDADFVKMQRYRICDLFQGVHVFFRKVPSWFVVHDTKGSQHNPGWAKEWHLGIEAEVGPPHYIWAIVEEVLLGKVMDNETGAVGDHIRRLDRLGHILAGEQGDGKWTHPPGQIDCSHTKVDCIVGKMSILVT